MTQVPAKRKRTGPASTYTPERGLEICERVAAGETLRAISAVSGMPRQETIRRWVLSFPDFRELYTEARLMQSHALFDEIIDYSHALTDMDKREEGRVYKDREAAVAIRAWQWAAGRLNPAAYGEHIPASVATSVTIKTSLDMNVKEAAPVVGGKTTYTIEAERVETAEEQRVRIAGEKDGKKASVQPKDRKPVKPKRAGKRRAARKALPKGEDHGREPAPSDKE